MPHTGPDWLTIKDWCVVVADGTRARFLALEPAATPEMESSPTLSEVKDLINPDFAASDEDVLRDINAFNCFVQIPSGDDCADRANQAVFPGVNLVRVDRDHVRG